MYLQRWHGWCHKKLLPSRRVLCTPYNHAPCDFMQSHIRKVYACLAVTCHLRFWQNDRDLLRAAAVTRGWNGYRNKSQHRKLTLEKKILPPLQQGFEPATFWSRVQRSNHWAIPTPPYTLHVSQIHQNSESDREPAVFLCLVLLAMTVLLYVLLWFVCVHVWMSQCINMCVCVCTVCVRVYCIICSRFNICGLSLCVL